MKKIIIVNNNMKIGGVQKSLCNLLWAIKDRYDVTLYLFYGDGDYDLPSGIRVLHCDGSFRYFGLSQSQCKGAQKYKRAFLRLICRFFRRPSAVRLMLPGQKTLPEHYDCAIAYLQNGNIRNLYGGVQDFVLHRIKAKKKIAFLHCDYEKSGANERHNNRLIARFDRIAACSEGCRRSFENVLPQCGDRCLCVRNMHRFGHIRALAQCDTVTYPADGYSVLMVTRLAHEKGIERALAAVAFARERGLALQLHIVGSGAMEKQLHTLAYGLGVQENVFFHGEQENPYRFMLYADLLLITSYYEAAPMVIDEAVSLALPILTTHTISAQEMIGQNGWICENSQDGINEALHRILSDGEALTQMRRRMRRMDNCASLRQFEQLMED